MGIRITVAANVGSISDLHTSLRGNDYILYRVAVNNHAEGTTRWFDCISYGKVATQVADALAIGTFVELTGYLDLNEYKGKPQEIITVNRFTVLTDSLEDEETEEIPLDIIDEHGKVRDCDYWV